MKKKTKKTKKVVCFDGYKMTTDEFMDFIKQLRDIFKPNLCEKQRLKE